MLWHPTGLMKALREPLVHFFVIGAAIFAVYGLTGDKAESGVANRIVVEVGNIERLAGLWQKQWQRPPTKDELKGLINQYVQEEVLYREALALGLDRDDTVVRRRLAQKFEFLSEDLAAAREPSAEELSAFFDVHRDRYRVPPHLSFTQLYFSPDRRSGSAEGDAELVLTGLRGGASQSNLENLGDRTLLDLRYRRQTPQEIAATFGQGFADAMGALDAGVWSGPIASGYGLHLVRVDERFTSRLPELAEVDAQVRADWSYDQRQRVNKEIFQLLLARYTVAIEGDVSDEVTIATPGADQGAAQ